MNIKRTAIHNIPYDLHAFSLDGSVGQFRDILHKYYACLNLHPDDEFLIKEGRQIEKIKKITICCYSLSNGWVQAQYLDYLIITSAGIHVMTRDRYNSFKAQIEKLAD